MTEQLVTTAHLAGLLGEPTGSRLVILVGPPACGKSTIAGVLSHAGYLSLSSDGIRQELYGDEAKQGNGARVFTVLYSRLSLALSQGLKVVVDATNTDRRSRNRLRKVASEAGCADVVIIYLNVPLDVCLARNRSRRRVVPDEVIQQMYQRLQSNGLPQPTEGRLLVLSPGPTADQYNAVQAEGG